MRDKGTSAVVCLGMLVGLLLMGLWPLNFFPDNDVSWLGDRNGLRFHGSRPLSQFRAGGVVFSRDPLVCPGQSRSKKGALSVEICLRPSSEPPYCKHRMIVLCDDSENETLFVAQWKSHLLVRVLTPGPNGEKRYREIGVDKALLKGKTRLVTITSDETGTTVYLDGKLADRFPDVRLIPEAESVSGRHILLGNSPDVTCPWPGDLFELALYDRSLKEAEVLQGLQRFTQSACPPSVDQDGVIALYTFNERSGTLIHNSAGSTNSLLILPRLQWKKRILVPPRIPYELRISDIKDISINTMAFIPFGFFLSHWLTRVRPWPRRRVLLLAIVLGVCVSLTIELLQIYLPGRDSSQLDLICNSLGTILGVIVFHAWRLVGGKSIGHNRWSDRAGI